MSFGFVFGFIPVWVWVGFAFLAGLAAGFALGMVKSAWD